MATATPDEVVGFIPVFKRGEVAAWTIVDEATFCWVKQRRWNLDGQGYAGHGKRLPDSRPGK